MNILEKRAASYEYMRLLQEQAERWCLELGLIKNEKHWWEFWKPYWIEPVEKDGDGE